MQRYKYPRTYHLPASRGMGPDDRRWDMETLIEVFGNKEVIVSEKCDGENSSIYSDGYTHARSINSGVHRSRTWMKAFAAQIALHLPEGWRACGENCYALHSIGYDRLPSYFLLFALYNSDNVCLSWDATEEWAQAAGVDTVPVIYRGVFDLNAIKQSYSGQSAMGTEAEGYVIRLAEEFSYDDQSQCMAKMVREGHVQTGDHWMNQPIVKNGLMGDKDLIKVWHILSEVAYERLQEKGWLGGDGRRVWHTFRRPYLWMIEQMNARIGPSSTKSDYPVWVWCKPKPDLRSSGHFNRGTKGYRLELLVPKSKLLLSDFEAWHFVLMNAYCPENLYSEYEMEDESKWEKEVESLGLHTHWDNLPEHLEKQKCDSWEHIFNLGNEVNTVQGTLWKIEKSQILKTTSFTAR